MYAKKLGGFPDILDLPRRQARRKECPYIEDLVLVGDFEELVDLPLQEISQPLNQLGPESLHCSPFQYPPRSPPRIMAGNVPTNLMQIILIHLYHIGGLEHH